MMILQKYFNRTKEYIMNIFNILSSLIHKWFNKKELFTLMIVPHTSEKNVKSVKFSKRLISIFVIINTVMFASVCIFAVSYCYLSGKLESKRLEYQNLQAANETNQKKLDEYKQNEDEIKSKVEELKQLEDKVKNIINTKGEVPQSSVTFNHDIASRGSVNLESSYLPKGSVSSELQSTYQTIDNLASDINNSIVELNEEIKEAQEKILAMKALPTSLPVYGQITSPFGYRDNPFGSGTTFHDGVDIANSYGTPIRAAGDGDVTFAGWKNGYGNLVIINHHNGYESYYGHNSKLAVKAGQNVKRGDIISYMGSTGDSTGTHCHFEVRLNGMPVDPLSIK